MNYNLIELFKNNKYKKIIKIIKNSEEINLDINDDQKNYFINYIVNNNNYKLLKKIFDLCKKKNLNIRIDILDNDNRIILYNCIKFNYLDIAKELLDYNKISIGLSIINIKDNSGYISLHYSIIFNNYDMFIILLNYNSNPFICNNDGDNSFIICINNNNFIMLEYLLNNNNNLNFTNIDGNSLLQIAVELNNNNIINLLLEKNINFNNTNYLGYTILHQVILKNNLEIFNKLFSYDIDFDKTDQYGNTALHFILDDLNVRMNYLKSLLTKNINYNISNIYGDLPLHILLNSDYDLNLIDQDLINKIILNSDINIQNNDKISCFDILISKKLYLKFKDLLINKELFYKKFESDKDIDSNLLDILIDSYFNNINQNKSNLKYKWELECLNDSHIIKCKNNIKKNILNKTIFSYYKKYNIKLENGTLMDNCFYMGIPIDILSGLILLYNNFKNDNLNLVLNYPLTINNNFNYQNDKLDFHNIEILWYDQKIYYPTFFDNEILNKINNSKYLVIPIGIFISVGFHANILFWDLENNTLERFEPNGANYPINYNYNPMLLDNLIENKFKNFNKDIIYYPPYKFLPNIGFQFIENMEFNCKKIGDPNGFCGVWCTWWVYQRMLNIKNNNLNIDNVAYELIKFLKYDDINFKTLIRNFSNKISNLRNLYINKYNLTINDFLNNNYTNEIINEIEKNILKDLSILI